MTGGCLCCCSLQSVEYDICTEKVHLVFGMFQLSLSHHGLDFLSTFFFSYPPTGREQLAAETENKHNL